MNVNILSSSRDPLDIMYLACKVCTSDKTIALNSGMKPEDARKFLPLATLTNLVMTVNLRELAHMCNQRLCNRAQAEIRGLFEAIREAVLRDIKETEKELYDLYDSLLVPQCEMLGYCPESKSCGKMEGKGLIR